MIGTIEVYPQSYSPDFPLDTLKSFVNSPSSIRVRNVPRKVGNWCITNVFATIAYPDNTVKTVECILTGGVYVATFDGCSVSGKVENGLTISANGKDENDNVVTGYVLGKGDVDIMDARDNVNPSKTVYYIHLLEDEPDVPMDGDMYKKDGNYVVYQNGVETQLGVSRENMESYVDQKMEEAVEEVEGKIPTKTSDIENDSGYLSSVSWNEVENKPTIPTKTSELTNDSNFITSEQVEPSTGYGMNGYAANSEYATQLKALDIGTTTPTDRGTIIPSLNYDSATNTYTLELYGAVSGYYPWYLRRLFGTDFSPVITLEWRKGSIFRKRVIGSTTRWTVVYNNNWMWLAKGKYAITCSTGDEKPDGNFYVLNYEDETHPNCINDPATDVHTITYGYDSITSIDGQAGGQTSQTIWCTRTNPNPVTIWERPFAYRNELPTKVSNLTNDSGFITSEDVPTKTSELTNDSGFITSEDVPTKTSDLTNDSGFITSADVPTKTSELTNDSQYVTTTEVNTALVLKQDKLSNTQVSAINSVVDERTTMVKFVNDTVRTYDIVGEVTRAMLFEWEEESGSVVKEVKFGNTVTSIGSDLFYFREQLTKATIPDSVTSIGSNAFYHCVSLTSIDIPDSVTYIGDQSFYECGLISIHLPKNLKSLETSVFSSCNLASIDLPAGLTRIKLSALEDNQYLQKLVIPESVTSIELNAFYDCNSLTSVVFEGKTISQVRSMANYPWGISDTSIIKTFNVASKEWVEERLAQLLAQLQS